VRKIVLLFALLLIPTLSAGGCQAAQDDIDIELMHIDEVQISIAESYPEQIFVYIKGAFYNSCSELHDVEVEPDGATINITVTTERPINATGLGYLRVFEKNVNLGSKFYSGMTYTVDVNGVTATFTYP
jgi:hypothetical protein